MNFKAVTAKRIPWVVAIIVAAVIPVWFLDLSLPDIGEGAGVTQASAALSEVSTAVSESESAIPDPAPAPIRRVLGVGRGDTLIAMLTGNGVSGADAYAALNALGRVFDARRLKPGQRLTLTFVPGSGGENPAVFSAMTLTVDAGRDYTVSRAGDGGFKATKIEKTLERRLQRASGVIRSSLYDDALKAKLPLGILMELIRIYSWDVDFQRDIRPGDRFEVMFERFFDQPGAPVRDGDILFAKLVLGGKARPLYRFSPTDGFADYFDDEGRSARKALLRTPLNGARLSSGYGRRRHPILGYTKMHRGVDFAARPGTPIFAAGNGRLVYRARNGAYGNYIRIRHNSEFSTAYAHLSRFQRNVVKGSRVKQGQIIGYVGTTGRSTGPHLHYEILRRGRQTNPMRVRMPSGRTLKGSDLALFEAARAKADDQYAALPETTEIVRNR